MNDYIEVNFSIEPYREEYSDILASMLCDIDFESFVPFSNGVTAYVPGKKFNASSVDNVIENFPVEGVTIDYQHVLVEGQDWNSEWEKNYFKPIVIGDICVIHSSFHHDYPRAKYDIVIDPKMAFGTGHHQTTTLMIESLMSSSIENKSVIDMGTGTGILAIFAAMLGASSVTGIEIDEFAFENALFNKDLNNQPQIKMICGDASALDGIKQADVFLANINRNIILNDIEVYSHAINNEGVAFFSGFYESDIKAIKDAASKFDLHYVGHKLKDSWAVVKFQKTLKSL